MKTESVGLQKQRNFYRAMHFSAKRGLAIAFRPSVRLTVGLTLVDCDHVGWKSWKLIARTLLLAKHLRSL